jgi:hypothetical protein
LTVIFGRAPCFEKPQASAMLKKKQTLGQSLMHGLLQRKPREKTPPHDGELIFKSEANP